MKAKFKLFSVLMLSMGLVLGACSNEATDNTDPDGPNPPAVTEYGYFSLGFMDTGSISSKAPSDGSLVTDPGSDEESNISSLRVVLYNTSTGVIEYAFDYNITIGGGNYSGNITSGGTTLPTGQGHTSNGIIQTPTSGATLKTEAEFVKLQPYNMVVLVNPTDKIKDFTAKGTGDTYSVFRDRKVADLGLTFTNLEDYSQALTGASEDNFFMTNFQEAIEVSTSALKDSKANAESNPVVAYVERAVAKVTFTNPQNSETDVTGITVPEGASISNLGWRLDITNKNSYLMRHITFDNSGTTVESTNPIVSVPNRHKLYAQDVNMDDVSWERYDFYNQTPPGGSPITDKDYPKGFFNYIAKTDVTSKFATGYEYALENTMVAAEQFEDVTTAAIVKLTYNPGRTALYDPADASNPDNLVASGANYYVWTSNAGSVYQAKYVFSAANLNAIKALPNDDTYPEFAALRAFLNDSETDLEDNGFGTGYTYTGAAKEVTVGNNKLAYHTPGENYYRVLIRHYDDVLQPTAMAWGRFGITRNNWYKLELKSVKGPGDIDIPEPKGPDDKFGFLAVEIRILPWVVRNQDANI